jgi:catechol 2,3-dioxygenase
MAIAENTTPAERGIAPPGFRLPAATRVGRVRLQVADLDRSIGYYESVMGLRVIARTGNVATVGARNDDDGLVELHARTGVRPATRRGLIGLYHFAILLPTRAALGQFVRHLASIGAYAGMSDHLVSEAVYLQDPDGLGIEVYADRPRDSWRAHNGELTMASEPLDVASLLAAAGDDSWSGAPRGTTMGHVHLYVRDIGQAAAFYHDALGFDKVVWTYPGALFMSAGGYHHHLGTNTWAAGAPLPTDADARMLEWELVLPGAAGVDAAAESLTAHGVAVEHNGKDVVARDPWGTQLRIIATR